MITEAVAIVAKLLKLGQLLGIKNKWLGYLTSLLGYGLLIAGLLNGHQWLVNKHHKAAFEAGQKACQESIASKVNKASTQAITQQASNNAAQAQASIASASNTGKAHAQQAQRIDQHFSNLEQEARHATPPATPPAITQTTAAHTDGCMLPDNRLRIWRAANDGASSDSHPAAAPHQSAASPKPIDLAATTASTGIRPAAGLGGEPSCGSQGLSPDRLSTLPTHCLR